ncbi:hypothetical protein PIROE2DRAFT_5859, partial [Piromyces sp. E2]
LLLAEPVIDNAINIFAAQAYLSSPHLYNQLVKDSVVASRKVEAGLSPYSEYFDEEESKEDIIKKKIESKSEIVDPSQNIKKISFEDYYKDWMNSATFLPKLNESRFKRYSHNPEEYHVKRNNNNDNSIEISNELSKTLSKCIIEGVKVNDENNTANLSNKKSQKIEDSKVIKKMSKPTSSNNKNDLKDNKKPDIVKSELSKKKNKNIIEDLKNIKKHEITNTIEKETDQISYVKKYFGAYKKPPIPKPLKNFDAKPEQVPIRNHFDLNSYDNVYSALMSTKKIIKESVREIESKLHIELNDEEKAILNEIIENEEYYNIFIRELEESQSKIKDMNDNDNGITENNNNNDDNNTENFFSYDSDVIHVKLDNNNNLEYNNNSNVIEKTLISQTEEHNTEIKEDYLTENENEDKRIEDIMKKQKYTDVLMNVSAMIPSTPMVYSEEEYNGSAHQLNNTTNIYNDNNVNNYNDNESNKYSDNNNNDDNNYDNENNSDYNKNDDNNYDNENNSDCNKNDDDDNNNDNDNDVIRNGDDPDGILEWCASLDHTKFDNIAMI